MAGLDVTHQLLVTPARIADVDAIGGRLATRARRPVPLLLGDVHPHATTTSPAPPCTTRWRCWRSPTRELFTVQRPHVAVETHGELTRGMTVIDRRDLMERPAPNCTVLEPVDADAAWSSIVEAVRAQRVRAVMGSSPTAPERDTFPRQHARTQRFTLGEPRDLVVSPDGERVVFARSRGGSDPVNCLWVVDSATGDEHLVADPRSLLATDDSDDRDDLPPEERARRERPARRPEVSPRFATDADVTVAAFALAGRLFVADLASHRRPASSTVDRPGVRSTPDPLGASASPTSRAPFCGSPICRRRRHACSPPSPSSPHTVTWGSADFVAAEEMQRQRGYWWSPDGST